MGDNANNSKNVCSSLYNFTKSADKGSLLQLKDYMLSNHVRTLANIADSKSKMLLVCKVGLEIIPNVCIAKSYLGSLHFLKFPQLLNFSRYFDKIFVECIITQRNNLKAK